MRILVLTDHWEPERNVPQRRWKWLAEILKLQGHDVYIATPSKVGGANRTVSCEKTEDGLSVIRTAGRKGNSSIAARSFAQLRTAFGSIHGVVRAFRRGEMRKPDLIIGTVPGLPTAIVTRALSALFGVPFGLDVRDAWPDLLDYSTDWNTATGHRSAHERIFSVVFRGLVVPTVRFALLSTYSRAQFIWTTSDRFGEELRCKVSDQSNRPRIVTVRNVFPPSTPSRRIAHNHHRDELRVVYAGKIGRAQKLNNAIRAARIAQEKGVPLKLRFIGLGVAVDELRRYSESLGVDIEFFGEMPPNELLKHYDWADTALVHLAEWEPLAATVPSKTFELVSYGIHITGVVTGETAEIIRMLEVGDTVRPGMPEELAALWNDLWKHPKRLRVSEHGRAWVTKEREVTTPDKIHAELVHVAETADVSGGKLPRE